MQFKKGQIVDKKISLVFEQCPRVSFGPGLSKELEAWTRGEISFVVSLSG